jgi:hypothetical protein
LPIGEARCLTNYLGASLKEVVHVY